MKREKRNVLSLEKNSLVFLFSQAFFLVSWTASHWFFLAVWDLLINPMWFMERFLIIFFSIKHILSVELVSMWISTSCRGWFAIEGRSGSINYHHLRVYLPGLVVAFQTIFCVWLPQFIFLFSSLVLYRIILSVFYCQKMCIIDVTFHKNMKDCLVGAQKNQTHLMGRSK